MRPIFSGQEGHRLPGEQLRCEPCRHVPVQAGKGPDLEDGRLRFPEHQDHRRVSTEVYRSELQVTSF